MKEHIFNRLDHAIMHTVIILALAIAFALVPGRMVQADEGDLVWSGTQSFAEDETIDKNITVSGKVVLRIASGKTLTVKSITIGDKDTLTMAGPGRLVVSGLVDPYAGLNPKYTYIVVNGRGTLAVRDGSVNSSVEVHGGKVTVTGGEMSNVSQVITVYDYGSVEVEGGSLTSGYGNGILLEKGYATIKGGTISSNYIEAIRMQYDTSLTMTGGTVKGFRYGILSLLGAVDLEGGTVEGSQKGSESDYDLYFSGPNRFTLKGSPSIHSVYIADHGTITITGPLSGIKSPIAVDKQKDHGSVFTKDYSTYNKGVDPETYFSSYLRNYAVTLSDEGEAQLTAIPDRKGEEETAKEAACNKAVDALANLVLKHVETMGETYPDANVKAVQNAVTALKKVLEDNNSTSAQIETATKNLNDAVTAAQNAGPRQDAIYNFEGQKYYADSTKSVYLAKARNAKTVTVPATVTINGRKTDVVGIRSGSFYEKTKTVKVASKKLAKSKVKNCLRGSKVTTIKVTAGKSYVSKYKKYFTKKNAGKAVKVK